MLHRLSTKWVAPGVTVLVTLGVVFAVNSLRTHAATPARAAAVHPLAAPAAATPARFTLTTGLFAPMSFGELSSISSQDEPSQYLTTGPGGTVIHTKQFGKAKPPVVVLKRSLDAAGSQALFAWHRAAEQGVPSARVTARLTIAQTGGTITFTLENAWLSKLDISGMKAGSGQVAVETATIVCDQIIEG